MKLFKHFLGSLSNVLFFSLWVIVLFKFSRIVATQFDGLMPSVVFPFAVRREIKILRLFMHPHIIRLYEVIETPTDIYVVMEHVKSGELFDYIVEKGRLQEDEARNFFQQVVLPTNMHHKFLIIYLHLQYAKFFLGADNFRCGILPQEYGCSQRP